jgi:predicted nucleic acid-binding protein
VSGVVADTSTWIHFLAGNPAPRLDDALAHGAVVLPPIVVAELVSGAVRDRDRRAIARLLTEIPLHSTPFDHWLRVGELRRSLKSRGISISTPDAHVAQCALDRDALLLSRDRIFERIARLAGLRVAPG